MLLGLTSLIFTWDIQKVGLAAASGVMVWGIISWHTYSIFIPTAHHLNSAAYLSIVAEPSPCNYNHSGPSADPVAYEFNEFTALKFSKEFFNTLLKISHKKIKAVLSAKGVQPFTSRLYLIKWPVRVY